MFKRTPARKRRREFKKFIIRSILVLVFIGLLGAVGFYFFFVQSKKSLYISPMSSVKDVAINDDDELTVVKKTLGKNKIEFESITASSSSYVVQLKNGGTVIFSSEKSLISQMSSLQFILSRLTMEGRTFNRLDLRFEKPIISK